MALTIKLAQGPSVHRLRIEDPAAFTFGDLQAHFRKLFSSLATAELHITYVDADGDHIVVSNDEELHDAFATVPEGSTLKLIVEPVAATKPPVQDTSATKEDDAVPAAGQAVLDGPLGELAAAFGLDRDVLQSMLVEAQQNGHDLTDLAAILAPVEAAMRDPELIASILPQVAQVLAQPEPTADASASADAAGPATHLHVTCDGCGINPIIGTRFKSLTKPNFDLCEPCEASGAFDDQLFLRIRTPEQAPAFAGVAPHACGGWRSRWAAHRAQRAARWSGGHCGSHWGHCGSGHAEHAHGCRGRGFLRTILSHLFSGRGFCRRGAGASQCGGQAAWGRHGCGRWAQSCAAQAAQAAQAAPAATPAATTSTGGASGTASGTWHATTVEDVQLARAIEASLRDVAHA